MSALSDQQTSLIIQALKRIYPDINLSDTAFAPLKEKLALSNQDQLEISKKIIGSSQGNAENLSQLGSAAQMCSERIEQANKEIDEAYKEIKSVISPDITQRYAAGSGLGP